MNDPFDTIWTPSSSTILPLHEMDVVEAGRHSKRDTHTHTYCRHEKKAIDNDNAKSPNSRDCYSKWLNEFCRNKWHQTAVCLKNVIVGLKFDSVLMKIIDIGSFRKQ